MDKLKDIIIECGAAKVGMISYSDCEVINSRLIDRLSFKPESVLVGIVPYYTHYCDSPRTISAYALAYDYHTYIKHMCETIITKAKNVYPHAEFAWFGDHSPINEKLAAAKSGLGIIGNHSLLITEDYSSFVFLFEIFTDLKSIVKPYEVLCCEGCHKCEASCPVDLYDKSTCLSALTQKKGELNDTETRMILESGCAWGCDICQMVCPHTQRAIKTNTIYTNTDWFNTNIIAAPTHETITDANDFSKRAYSWRGPATILRNINIINQRNRSDET